MATRSPSRVSADMAAAETALEAVEANGADNDSQPSTAPHGGGRRRSAAMTSTLREAAGSLTGQEGKRGGSAAKELVERLTSLIDMSDIQLLAQCQAESKQRLEESLKMLEEFNSKSQGLYDTAKVDFIKHTKMAKEMRQDLESIMYRTRALKKRLKKHQEEEKSKKASQPQPETTDDTTPPPQTAQYIPKPPDSCPPFAATPDPTIAPIQSADTDTTERNIKLELMGLADRYKAFVAVGADGLTNDDKREVKAIKSRIADLKATLASLSPPPITPPPLAVPGHPGSAGELVAWRRAYTHGEIELFKEVN